MTKKVIYTDHAPAPIGPYSQAVQAGKTLYVSGQIAIDPTTGETVTDDLIAETHQVMKNLIAVLKAAGYTLNDVVKCSIFIADMQQFATINEVYGSYFSETYPARETVEVACLPKQMNVEISCIAVK